MTRNYHEIFSAHFKTKLSLMLWGSSGYGKTSVVNEYAASRGFESIIIHAQYLDPLALFIPATFEMKDLGYVKMYPSQILSRVFTAKKRTILFLDELTRAREETFNILTELLVDRSIFGFKVPDHVLIIAASNFSEEDSGVRDLPDAVMQRLTHLIHAPEEEFAIRFLRSASAREILSKDPKLMRPPARFPIHDLLKPCPRQIDACGALAEIGLRGDSLMDVCRGRVGIEAGTEIAIRLEMNLTGKVAILPERIDTTELPRLARVEKGGGVIEIVRYLCEQMNDRKRAPHIAAYLLEFASPEVCRSMQVHGFSFSFSQTPKQIGGKPFMTPAKNGVEARPIEGGAKPWQWYAIRLGKLTPR